MKKRLLICAAVLGTASGYAQLTMTDSLSDSQVTTLLEGLGVTISSLSTSCPATALAEFNGTSEMPITHGIVLATGIADQVAGPNNTGSLSYAYYTPGDSTIEGITTSTTYDACVVEFDFVPGGDTLNFNFVFGSEEYLEFVSAGVSDAFGVFISGPGITGIQNCATTPGGTPVSIDSVNSVYNPSYFYNNETVPGNYIQFDGFTSNLAGFAEVLPGSTYHCKIAIADAGDAVYDSGVFIEAFSFRSNVPLAVTEPEKEKGLFLYPNPSTGVFSISSLEKGSILRIFDATGQLLSESEVDSATESIDLSDRAAGVYFCTLTSESGVHRARMIKQ